MGSIRIINRRKAVSIVSGDLRTNDCIGSNTIKFMIISDNATELVTIKSDVESDGNGSGGVDIIDDVTGVSYYRTTYSNTEVATLPTNKVLKLEIQATANTEYVDSRGIHMILIGDCSRKAIQMSGATSVEISSSTLGQMISAKAVQTVYADDPESGGGIGGGLNP